MIVPLAEHVRRYVSLSPEDERKLWAAAKVIDLGKRSQLFSQGESGRVLVYVESGLLRLYAVDEAAKERTLQFGLEGWWIADWESFERGLPSRYSLQALEPSRVAVLSYEQYEPLLAAVPALEKYFRRIYQRAFGAAQRRMYLNETSDGETMYHEFRTHYPDFVQRVPQYMLASFLGFTPEFLSKIRARS